MKIANRLMNVLSAAVAAAATLHCGGAVAESAPVPEGVRLPEMEGGFPPLQQLDGIPVFVQKKATLETRPRSKGPRVSLFNGKDLAEFTPWLGYANGSLFPEKEGDAPLGQTGVGEVFKVVQEEGRPAIYLSGRIWGALNSKRDLSNYHLHLAYKFGRQWHEHVPRNTGVLYHSYGRYGAFSGTFMSSLEFEIADGLTGMLTLPGKEMRATVELGKGPGAGLFGLGDYRYMPGGQPTAVRLPTMLKQGSDVERPAGQWNTIDLYVAGDASVHVVNGVPVMALSKITKQNSDGTSEPHTHGRIQIQSEGTEVYVRDVWIESIDTVPKVMAR